VVSNWTRGQAVRVTRPEDGEGFDGRVLLVTEGFEGMTVPPNAKVRVWVDLLGQYYGVREEGGGMYLAPMLLLGAADLEGPWFDVWGSEWKIEERAE
jgi:hypothetical protein